jgi:hypothetical protein
MQWASMPVHLAPAFSSMDQDHKAMVTYNRKSDQLFASSLVFQAPKTHKIEILQKMEGMFVS